MTSPAYIAPIGDLSRVEVEWPRYVLHTCPGWGERFSRRMSIPRAKCSLGVVLLHNHLSMITLSSKLRGF